MPDQEHFTISATFDEWRAQEHNDRTWHAWAAGVKRAAFPRDTPSYSRSHGDYRDAEEAGHAYGIYLLKSGLRFRCEECGAEHPRKETP